MTSTPFPFLSALLRCVLSAAALALLFTGSAHADAVCGDVNATGTVTSSDALAVLRTAVGQEVDITCSIASQLGDASDLQKTLTIPKDRVHGQKVNVPRLARITHYGIVMREAGVSARMGLYTDDNGSPGTLVAGSLQQTLKLGSQEFPTATEKKIAPGDYWVVANFFVEADVAGDDAAGESAVIKEKVDSVTAGLPATFGAATEIVGERLNYWIRVVE